MRSRLVMAAAGLLLVCGTAQAEAGGSAAVPAPTSTYATYVAGVRSPQTLINGGWNSASTDRNEWSGGGTGLTGTTTYVDATWASSWRWVDRHRPGLFVRAEAEHTDYLPGVADTTWSYTVEERTRHSGWYGFGMRQVQAYDPQFIEDLIASELDTEDAKVLVQYRVTFHAVVQGTYRERFALDVVSLGHA
jgi:hypothetical protein